MTNLVYIRPAETYQSNKKQNDAENKLKKQQDSKNLISSKDMKQIE